jgi:hypothetical protein
VLVCLSEVSVSKVGYIQKELKFALDIADQQPPGAIYLIPVRLEPCMVPDRLRHLQYVDLFSGASAYDMLTTTIKLSNFNGKRQL